MGEHGVGITQAEGIYARSEFHRVAGRRAGAYAEIVTPDSAVAVPS
jgi:hypothetical protein